MLLAGRRSPTPGPDGQTKQENKHENAMLFGFLLLHPTFGRFVIPYASHVQVNERLELV